ncbi:ASST-domain-containing protein [Dactylonectria estremocensis]|uniref:ASST-domain-containing protein n=1 Tax=Dactylonectria estremocensis TaxID=1079267 RepID=A0A9P9J5S8_9HYPO|nr:ASST-domain-containing protein [Dactylonectria estremocensis]
MKPAGFVSVLAACARADSPFRSRPDLSPPRFNITIPAADDASPGFLFVTPYPGFGGSPFLPEQPAAYIFRDNGDLVWSSLGYFSGFVANFQAATYQGHPVLQAFQGTIDPRHGRGHGTLQLLDHHYRPVAQVQSVTNKIPSIHELRIIDGKTALIEIYDPVPYDLTPYGGSREQNWIVDSILQEVDIETGELIFEVHSLDIVSPADSLAPLPAGAALDAPNAWDYFHLNSIDKDDEGNYLISARHTSTIYKLSGRDGSIIWQLGGKRSTFDLPSELDFGYQHDARFLNRSADGAIETISFFDNSAWTFGPNEEDQATTRSHSRALIVELNHNDKSLLVVHSYASPDGLSAHSQGNAQILPNGNVFVNWGQEGAVTEFLADGTPIFNAFLDTDAAVQSYRGFRFEWTGRPRETPSVAAVRRGAETTVHVSWNGDTEVALWRFYAQDGDGNASSVGKIAEAERTSFETSATIPTERLREFGDNVRIFAAGFDRQGTVLDRSRGVAVVQAVHSQGEDDDQDGEL